VKATYRTKAILQTNAIIALTGLCALLALPAMGFAGESAKSLEAIAAETATTAAQHQALAAYYREKAADQRAVVKTHKDMAASFVSKADTGASNMRAHCESLGKAAEQLAAEYDAMAAVQDEEAKKAGK